ncbi:MAG: AAA family ATPase [Dasosvirus sp.]|uniref:AAA family ATPase n=1 Tax=Dasosvirus sp. TaxID=2487764 RepID=A0A3G4ZR57_9VIRU|nr:MAG: AAA family ATPase [Dasosvirus sp.]
MTAFLTKHVQISSFKTNDDPSGWVTGWGFIGYVLETSNGRGTTKDLYILITRKQFNLLIDGQVDEEGKERKENKKINFLEREGLFWNLSYPSRQIDLPEENPWESQKQVIEQIVKDYNLNKYTTVLLAGKPATGKSMIPLYLCKHLTEIYTKVTLVDTWNPTEPGDFFGAIYNKVNPSITEPLVVVLEEVDGIVMAMHQGDIKISSKIAMPIQVKSKTDWNQLLDRFDRKMYTGVILVLTTNKTLQWFDDLDPSYTRKGRINLRCEIL